MSAAVWANDLADVSADDAHAAMIEHFRSSTEYLAPVHIIRGVRALNVKATMSPEVPAVCTGKHLWLPDGTCANCLAVDQRTPAKQWSAPGWGDGIPVDKPDYYDEMVAAAAAATKACIEAGYTHGDDVTRKSAWDAAEAVREAHQA